MFKTTKEQRKALLKLYIKEKHKPDTEFPSYKSMRRQLFQHLHGVVMIRIRGIYVGIESNGHIHS